MNDNVKQNLRNAAIIVAAGAVAGLVGAWVIRSQISRHQRGIFSPHAFQRLAALGHMGRAEASVDRVNLLRDFVVWETRPLLRNRARAILRRMERELTEPGPRVETGAA